MIILDRFERGAGCQTGKDVPECGVCGTCIPIIGLRKQWRAVPEGLLPLRPDGSPTGGEALRPPDDFECEFPKFGCEYLASVGVCAVLATRFVVPPILPSPHGQDSCGMPPKRHRAEIPVETATMPPKRHRAEIPVETVTTSTSARESASESDSTSSSSSHSEYTLPVRSGQSRLKPSTSSSSSSSPRNEYSLPFRSGQSSLKPKMRALVPFRSNRRSTDSNWKQVCCRGGCTFRVDAIARRPVEISRGLDCALFPRLAHWMRPRVALIWSTSRNSSRCVEKIAGAEYCLDVWSSELKALLAAIDVENYLEHDVTVQNGLFIKGDRLCAASAGKNISRRPQSMQEVAQFIAQRAGLEEGACGVTRVVARNLREVEDMRQRVLRAHGARTWKDLNFREGQLVGGFVFTHAEPLKNPLLYPGWEIEAPRRYGLAGVAFFSLREGQRWSLKNAANLYHPQPTWKLSHTDRAETIPQLQCNLKILEGPETTERRNVQHSIEGVSIGEICRIVGSAYNVDATVPSNVLSLHPAMAESIVCGIKRREMRPHAFCKLIGAPFDESRRSQYTVPERKMLRMSRVSARAKPQFLMIR